MRITNGFMLEALLSQAYDMSYGLYNYDSPQANPLGPMLVHPGEKLDFESPKRRLLKRYRGASVLKHTGLSWDAFLKRTHQEVEDILEECVSADADAVRDLETLQEKFGKP